MNDGTMAERNEAGQTWLVRAIKYGHGQKGDGLYER